MFRKGSRVSGLMEIEGRGKEKVKTLWPKYEENEDKTQEKGENKRNI